MDQLLSAASSAVLLAHSENQHRSLQEFGAQGHWSLSIAAIVFICCGLLLSLWGRHFVKITVLLTAAIFGWLVLSDVAYQASIKNNQDEEAANNIALVCGIIGALVFASLAWRIVKFGFFVLGCLFGILLASTINTAFLHNAVAGVAGQNNVGYVVMALFALVFGIIFYCFTEKIVIVGSAFIGSYLLFRGIGYYAGDFPNTFNIGQTVSHQPIGNVPTAWYVYFCAIIGWTILGIYVQYYKTSKKSGKQGVAKQQGRGQAL
jgi:hypothetical protein